MPAWGRPCGSASVAEPAPKQACAHLRAQVRGFLVELESRLIRMNRQSQLIEHGSGVDSAIHEVRRHARRGVAVDHRPDQGRDAAIARQKCRMEVDNGTAEAVEQRGAEDLGVTDRESELRLPGAQLLDDHRDRSRRSARARQAHEPGRAVRETLASRGAARAAVRARARGRERWLRPRRRASGKPRRRCRRAGCEAAPARLYARLGNSPCAARRSSTGRPSPLASWYPISAASNMPTVSGIV